ncbi:phospholipase D family protein [Stutzerimonas nosocomialis]|uniref:phospholipase D family protein n=1 Tax=Stutzerimonas nosocomialis TaxID=1056496 RepID=UPI00110997D1|nr:phospholipase D family protein [Stutzerimonas nosocomialis]TLX58859.1 phospholipase D family protein [Stutzerimonas nosocomialis]TLX61126.1 phospholipase D family protein [Stutzerimonas nosocomialis]
MRVLILAVLLLAGCAQVAPIPSHSFPPDSTPLGRRILEMAEQHPPGYSGFRLLHSSTEAFAARIKMFRSAQATLDVQYYIVHDGLSTRALVKELLQAADRGVRVRLLLDDTTSDGNDYQIARLAAHPNIQARVFNPLHVGRSTFVTRSLGRLMLLSRQHRRMHNKVVVVDSSLAIVGGRNLGDEYFEVDQGFNFTDIDLLGVGPVATELARSFDEYWNHELSIPIQRFLWRPPTERSLAEARQQVADYLEQARLENSERWQHLMTDLQQPQFEHWLQELTWAPGQALWDHPDKIGATGLPDPELLLTTRLEPTLRDVEHELTLVSAYFVPTQTGVEYFARKAEAGITIRLLTNSLEATDVPIVHGGYAPYRPQLLEMGVQLYEMRRQPEEETSYNLSGSSESSLHSKAAVFDQQRVFIGSLNFDPRSVLWNTEVGILVESPDLARQVHELTLEGMAPSISYEVRLQERDGQQQLVWLAEDDGQSYVLDKEPGGAWRRFNAWIARVIGLERML